MDTYSLGAALLGLDAIQADRGSVRADAAEDAYYRQHTPVERRMPRGLPVIAAFFLGFVAAGLLIQ
jgi:hypothetical protein